MHSKLVALFFQNSISTKGVGLCPSSRGWAESFFRTSLIWWVQSMITDSMAWIRALSSESLQKNKKQKYKYSLQIIYQTLTLCYVLLGFLHLVAITYLSSSTCSTFSAPTGRGRRVLPFAWPHTTYTLLFKLWTCLVTSLETTWGHCSWFLSLDRSGTKTYKKNEIISTTGIHHLEFSFFFNQNCLKIQIYIRF